jgi:hypothetical protein
VPFDGFADLVDGDDGLDQANADPGPGLRPERRKLLLLTSGRTGLRRR